MRSSLCIGAVFMLGSVGAAPITLPEECVRKHVETVTSFSVQLFKTTMDSQFEDADVLTEAGPFLKARDEVLDAMMSIAEMMSDSTTEEELAENKRAALEALKSKSSEWTSKFLAAFDDSPLSHKQKMSLAEHLTEGMTLICKSLLLQIELESENCF